jgi:hypothetical protein
MMQNVTIESCDEKCDNQNIVTNENLATETL